MYKIAVPLTLGSSIIKRDRDRVHADLQAIGATRVFISDGQLRVDPEKRKKSMQQLRENVRYFKDLGYEVGIWNWTLWAEEKLPFAEIESLEGKKNNLFYCPLDPDFRAYAADYVAEIATLSPDMIQYDDDFRFTHFGNGVNCFCEHHMREISRILGEEVDRETLKRELFTGGQNRYRDAWLEAKATGLRLFADEMRAAVDRVDPNIRLSYCSCISNWGAEGVSAVELAQRFAGKTKPFMRLSGAPYWAVKQNWGNRLQNVIEFNRSQIAECHGSGVEIFSEGDVYPRPRYKTPAAYLEGMDLALRFAGGTDGMLKYMHDYTSRITYERGYLDRHIANAELYRALEEEFSGGDSVGIRVYDRRNKILDKTFCGEDASMVMDNITFNAAARALSDNAIPSTYEGEGICSIAFGEDVLDVPRNVYKNGVIIDLTAAQILKKQGVDVGLLNVNNLENSGVELLHANFEQFLCEDECVLVGYGISSIEVAPGAKIDSEYRMESVDGQTRLPAAYFYENGDGEKFFVLAHSAYFNSEDTYRSYARARQLRRAAETMSGRKLPAFVDGNPDVYLLSKRAENGDLLVALFNFSVDVLLAPVIETDRTYNSVTALCAEATLCEGGVRLSDIAPFKHAFLRLSL